MALDTTPKGWWKDYKIESAITIDDCNEALVGFDEVIASLHGQVETAKIRSSNGQEMVDEAWFADVNSALGYAMRKRKQITMRRETLIQVRGQRKKDEMLDFYQLAARTLEGILLTLQKIEAKL